MTARTNPSKAPQATVQQPAAQLTPLEPGYLELLKELKTAIRTARVKAALAVNRELVLLYWRIGKEILQRQKAEGWGTKVIERVAEDLRAEFPDMTGLSVRNMKYMLKIAAIYPDEQIVQQLAAQIPWFHNCVIIDKTSTEAEREFYIRKTIENGWSRNVLVHQIESGLYQRLGKLTHNFDRTLPPEQSDLVREIFKDPYKFECCGRI